MSSVEDSTSTSQHPHTAVAQSQDHLAIRISTVTGLEWIQCITPDETVQSLKEKIWKRCGLLPYHQALAFCGETLSDECAHVPLHVFGVRHNSNINLLVVARSGPLALPVPQQSVSIAVHDDPALTSFNEVGWQGDRIFGERFLEENRRTLFKMCQLRRQMRQNVVPTKSTTEPLQQRQMASAPEDTSAKESSAGDTECEENAVGSFPLSALKLPEMPAPSTSKSTAKRNRQSSAKDEGCGGRGMASARERLLLMMHSRCGSSDINTYSEDASDLSSGMLICDLSNEFRRLRVRRRHHCATDKARARSKPRAAIFAFANQHGSDVTSSDDERPCLRRAPDALLSSMRRPWALAKPQKTFTACQSQQRCYACAAKLNSFSLAFQCRCGKTLCARHRAPHMHTCNRLRKLQDVSD